MTAPPDPPDVDGITWRRATLEDADAIAVLQAACAVADDGWIEEPSEIRERFDSPMADAGVDSLIGVSISGEILVSLWSLILPEPTDEWPVYDDNYIHPDWRTEILRSFALDWWEARSLERIAPMEGVGRSGSSNPPESSLRSSSVPLERGTGRLPVRFHQHVYPAQETHIADIAGRGYEPWIYFDELRRDLSEPVDPPLVPEGYVIKPIGDAASIDVLVVRNDAFRDHRGSQQWTLEFWESRSSEMHRADASFVVVNGSVPVAFVRCGVYPHDAKLRGYTEGWIEQVGTVRAHRGRGLAAALIQSAMAVFASSGIEYATLEVDTENPTGAHGLYTGLGFERVRGYVDYTKVVDL